MFPKTPSEFVLYYAAGLLLALVVFMRRRPRKGMRLRLRGSAPSDGVSGGHFNEKTKLKGMRPPEEFSHIQQAGERPLNVVFNYNGHSWDAYEVLGLPAGSSPEKVEEAFANSMKRVEPASRPFLEAAHRAIHAEWDGFKKASEG